MKYETFVQYKSNIRFIQGLLMAVLYIQILVGTFHLFVPSIMANSQLTLLNSIIMGVVINLGGFLMAARIADLEGSKMNKYIRLIAIIGIIHQYFLGLPTIYTITIFTVALIGENIIIPNLEIIQRTQHLVSRDKLTKEVYQAVSHADNYMKDQVTWITNSLILLIIVSIVSIFMISLFNILPLLVTYTSIIQTIALVSLIFLILIVVILGFPKFRELPSKYDLDNI